MNDLTKLNLIVEKNKLNFLRFVLLNCGEDEDYDVLLTVLS
jgi:hypothetical protein